jgi:hypothetical protein
MSAGRAWGLVVLAVAGLGCAQGSALYRWGIYEDLLYDMYKHPGTADPATQVAKLREDIARTESEGRRVAPGIHAHLGYMYYLQGNAAAAEGEFRKERDLFPESAPLMDGMLRRMGAS